MPSTINDTKLNTLSKHSYLSLPSVFRDHDVTKAGWGNDADVDLVGMPVLS
jgi:hypothetical protein